MIPRSVITWTLIDKVQNPNSTGGGSRGGGYTGLKPPPRRLESALFCESALFILEIVSISMIKCLKTALFLFRKDNFLPSQTFLRSLRKRTCRLGNFTFFNSTRLVHVCDDTSCYYTSTMIGRGRSRDSLRLSEVWQLLFWTTCRWKSKLDSPTQRRRPPKGWIWFRPWWSWRHNAMRRPRFWNLHPSTSLTYLAHPHLVQKWKDGAASGTPRHLLSSPKIWLTLSDYVINSQICIVLFLYFVLCR